MTATPNRKTIQAGLDNGTATNDAPFCFSAKSSDLQIPPGMWPTNVPTDLGNGRVFSFRGKLTSGAAEYRQSGSLFQLTVYTD